MVHTHTQGKLEAKPMTEAISVLEQAWAIAYKEIGKDGSKVATIDMITGAPAGPHPAAMCGGAPPACEDGCSAAVLAGLHSSAHV